MRVRITFLRGVLLLYVKLAVAQTCQFCPHHDVESSAAENSLVRRDQPLNLLGDGETCGDLYDRSASLQSDDLECGLVQSISTLCGCPLRDEACSLCVDGNAVPEQSLETQVPLPSDFETAALLLGENIIAPTASCQVVQAYAQSKKEGRKGCLDLQQNFGAACDCPLAPNTDDSTSNESNSTIINEGTGEENCGFCRKGANTMVPEKDLSAQLLPVMTLEEIASWEKYSNGTGTTNLTCGSLEAWHHSLQNDDIVCRPDWGKAVKGLCQCPAREDMCRVCADSVMTNPDISLASMLSSLSPIELNLTCRDMKSVSTQYKSNGAYCFLVEHFQFLCGCDGVTERLYLGADTSKQKRWLAWFPRIFATFSLLGSISILRDVLKDSRKRRQIYPQLVMAMSVGDICSSIAWFMSTWPLPAQEYGFDSDVYGASGTAGTCATQGFLLQLGFTGIFYNASLCVYYMVVIVYRMRDSQLQRYKFHVPPVVIGLALALAGLPHYTSILVACHIPPPPIAVNQTLLNVFVLIPIATVMVLCTGSMVFIYYHVWKQDRAANRWRLGERTSSMNDDDPPNQLPGFSFSRIVTILLGKNGSSQQERPRNRLSASVKYQAALYVTAFLLTWPIYFWGVYRYDKLYKNFPFWAVTLCLAPLQGFWNAIVYFRVRIAECLTTLLKDIRHVFTPTETNSKTQDEANRAGNVEQAEKDLPSIAIAS